MYDSTDPGQKIYNYNQNFILRVKKVYYTTVIENNRVKQQAGTFDGVSPNGRGEVKGVRILVPSAPNTGVQAGLVTYPSVGDTTVCAYLEGYPDYPVCFGVLMLPSSSSPSKQASKQQDMVVHHPSNSFLRLRNKANTEDKIETEVTASEIRLQHRSGCNIVIEDFLDGNDLKTAVMITGPQNATFVLDSAGNVSIVTSGNIYLKGKKTIHQNYIGGLAEKTRELFEEGKDEVHTNRTIERDTFTGKVYRGVPFHISTTRAVDPKK